MTMRQDAGTADWPLRPWIMAAICAVCGLILHFLIDSSYDVKGTPARNAVATFVAIAAIAFVLTVEQRRALWALMFALGAGLTIASIGWFTAQYNFDPTIFEWPFLSAIFAGLIAAPLFQTVRDEGAWRFPYARLHRHAWTDSVIGASALCFVGVAFLLAWLIAGLFDLIGIEQIKDLLLEDWFGWTLAGFAFGAAVGLLRERDALVGTMQRLNMVTLGVLAPVLAAALVLFLLSLPFTGLESLWKSPLPATAMMLVAGAGAILLANAVFGNGDEDRSSSRVLRVSAMALVLAVLPLAIIAAIAIGQRIGQYGWTPGRIWGVIAVGVALAYGAAGYWSVAKGRGQFDDVLRPLQTKLALGLCGLALFLALPILDFGAISAKSQTDRFAQGRVAKGEFDWQAMAFDFGPAGRRRLAEIARSGSLEQQRSARAALAAEARYLIEADGQTDGAETLDARLRIVPEGVAIPDQLRKSISATRFCTVGPCVVTILDETRAIIAGTASDNDPIGIALMKAGEKGTWQRNYDEPMTDRSFWADLSQAKVELRTIERRQLYIDGRPIGDAYK